MSRFSSRGALLLVAVAALLLGTAVTAVAIETKRSGGSVTAVSIETQNAPLTITSSAWTPVETAQFVGDVGDYLLIRFSAESSCSGGVGGGWCSVQITIDGVEAEPVAGTDFAFDSTDNATESGNSWEAHSMERAYTVTANSDHNVKVWGAVVGAGSFRLDDWAVSILTSKP